MAVNSEIRVESSQLYVDDKGKLGFKALTISFAMQSPSSVIALPIQILPGK